MSDSTREPLWLTPELSARPWAGARFSAPDQHAGEAWLTHDGSLVSGGPARGQLLGDLAHQRGTALVGRRGAEARSAGFPFLVKLIDTSDWLGVQVHPDDAQAIAIEGEGSIGKTESWIVLEAGPEARVLVGPRADVEPERVLRAIGTPELPDLLQECEVQAGDRIHVRTLASQQTHNRADHSLPAVLRAARTCAGLSIRDRISGAFPQRIRPTGSCVVSELSLPCA